ncbi:hypothetical protein IQ225_16290, partial [Synechocystis salina LEGE 06155]|nr:hypothetical protein [Synechocystis salina LEGE 06155]
NTNNNTNTANIANDFAEDGPPALSQTSSGDVLIAWSSDTPPITPISSLTDGNRILLTFADKLNNDSANLPTSEQFQVTVNGVVSEVGNVTVVNNTVEINLNNPVQSSD